MGRSPGFDTYNRIVVAGSLLTATVTGGIGLSLVGRDGLSIGAAGTISAASGAMPWLCIGLLRPRILAGRRMHPGIAVAASAGSLLGIAGLAWFIGLALTVGSDDAPWLALPLIGIAVAAAAALASRSIARGCPRP